MADVALPAQFIDLNEFISECDITPVDTVSRGQTSPYTGTGPTPGDELDFGGEWLSLRMRTVGLDRAEMGALVPTVLRAARANNRLLLRQLPSVQPRGAYPGSGTIAVSVTALAGSRTLTLSGLTPGALLASGDMLLSPLLYPHMITQDVLADVSGVATVDLFPRLKATLTAGASVTTYASTRAARWRVTKLPEYNTRASALSSITIECTS